MAGMFFSRNSKIGVGVKYESLIDDYKNFIFILPVFLWQILERDVARVVTSIFDFFFFRFYFLRVANI